MYLYICFIYISIYLYIRILHYKQEEKEEGRGSYKGIDSKKLLDMTLIEKPKSPLPNLKNKLFFFSTCSYLNSNHFL